MPQEETLRALDDLIREGKVRYIGCSTFPAWMVMEALAISDRLRLNRYVTEQPPYNLLDRRIENELVPLALRYGLGLLPWSPLAMGVLAGRYAQAGEHPPDSRAARIGHWAADRVSERAIDAASQVAEIARQNDMTPSQLSLLWVANQPAVTAPIIGPRTLDQLKDALAILDRRLEPDVMATLDEVVPPGSAVADFHNTSGWMRMKLL
jgi:aryl-alcohol dehydrogenase-like predicted oxidoreductase